MHMNHTCSGSSFADFDPGIQDSLQNCQTECEPFLYMGYWKSGHCRCWNKCSSGSATSDAWPNMVQMNINVGNPHIFSILQSGCEQKWFRKLLRDGNWKALVLVLMRPFPRLV